MRIENIERTLTGIVQEAAQNLIRKYRPATISPLPEINIEIPKDISHADYTTNLAMRISKGLGRPPLDAAGELKDEIEKVIKSRGYAASVEKVDAAGAGFINFLLSRSYLEKVLFDIIKKGDRFGSSTCGRGKAVLIEFVSANPTGPLTIAHARQAAIGDALANIMAFSGFRVHREYYVNDEGRQVDLLGLSLRARYLGLCGVNEEIPQDGYVGDYVLDLAKGLKKRMGKRLLGTLDDKKKKIFSRYAVSSILNGIRKDLKDFGVKFTNWFYQSSLTRKRIEEAFGLLRKKGLLFEHDGETGLKSTSFGDEKDRVVIKSDGSMTYLGPDIAYHLNKYRRGYKTLINIWGPDHHGYVSRLTAACKGLGYDAKSISVLIVQLATLYRRGQALSMSTRKGEFITLREVTDEVGKDVGRFIFLSRKTDSHLDFDIEAAKRSSKENPVYYIQYAHARIWSILNYFRSKSTASHYRKTLMRRDPSALCEEEEILLERMLCQFPAVVRSACDTLEPYRVIEYMQELAKIFHAFYTKHRVVTDNKELTSARLLLVEAVKITLANGLRLVGVSLPKEM